MKLTFYSAMLLASLASSLYAQGADKPQAADTIAYTDATQLRLINRGFADAEKPYYRLPKEMSATTRDHLFNKAELSSGIAVRFRTNSPFVAVRYKLSFNVVMDHMAQTGTKGVDLYAMTDNGTWRYVITGRPQGKENELVLIKNMEPRMREYMLYLPLYDGVDTLEIGVARNAVIDAKGDESPRAERPVVFYGTSITQGGCASRTGMSYTNILSRRLNREVINLGFSGNGQLDLDVSEQMARLAPSCYVMDCVPNVNPQQIRERGFTFLENLRRAHPTVPIVMTEGPYFPHQDYDLQLRASQDSIMEAWQELYAQFKAKYPDNLYYVSRDGFAGTDHESFVDAIHLTDLGFERVADRLYPVLQPLVRDTRVIAHRGYWDTEGSAQNSITSLRKAAEIGVFGSEFDVQMTADTIPVVNHDPTINGVVINDTPYKKLRKQKLANGETIPTLEAYLLEGRKHPELKLILEIKSHKNAQWEQAAVDRVVALVNRFGMTDQVEYISFSPFICRQLRKALPNAKIAVLTNNVKPEGAYSDGLTGVDYNQNTFRNNPSYWDDCRRLGLSTNAWTIDDLKGIREFKELGVDYITTNKPVEALEITRVE
jgi:glycerophosphoryl diester phosphodiesterase/lysophospholipase L1-like esterase